LSRTLALAHRLIEKHIPKQQKTNFIHALAEKLETAPPDMFTAEVYAHAQKLSFLQIYIHTQSQNTTATSEDIDLINYGI